MIATTRCGQSEDKEDFYILKTSNDFSFQATAAMMLLLVSQKKGKKERME